MLFIHDISRTEIRLLARKWPNIPSDKKEEFIDKIIEVLKQHSMPFNFWTLSIFLWIFSGKNTLNFNNNSELIELYIDDLLDRNRLASDPQNRFSYQNYKLLLSELAYELLMNYRDTNYSIKYSELMVFTEAFMRKNPKRVGITSEVVYYLLHKGVLKKMDNDLVTFRLNGVFEYFIAYSFNENTDLLDTIIQDENVYLSFKNGFEIYSGFPRSASENKHFMKTIFEKTKAVFKELNDRMTGELDFRLNSSIEGKELLDLSEPIKQITQAEGISPLTDEEKDQFYNENNLAPISTSEVKSKKVYDVSVKDCEILERYLLINGRVFRNIENINDKKLINEIFDFMIEASCNFGFALIEELEQSNLEEQTETLKTNIKQLILQLFNNYLPIVVQGFLSDAMGNINLEAIIKEKINLYKVDYRNNQYKLFILYSLLLDVDLKRYKHYLDELTQIARMGIIKSSVLLKLCNLLMLKSYDDDAMISFLKEKIREMSLMINPKTDMKQFDRKFEKTYKALLLKRQLK